MQHKAQTLLFIMDVELKISKFDKRLKYLTVPEPEQEATRSHKCQCQAF